MVFFTCNACGQSIKKAHVEKHYLTECRSCEVLSCMDCGKDFVGDDYKHHTKCVSENEKYGGKDYKATAKANKGEVKQSQWIESVQAASSSQSVSPRVRGLLNRLADYNNIPRKKAKFERFIQNSLKVWDTSIIEQIWKVFSEAGSKKPEQKPTEDVTKELETAEGKSPENGDNSSGGHSETDPRPLKEVKMKKTHKEPKHPGRNVEELGGSSAQEEGLGKEEDDQDQPKKKKKKKKRKSESGQDSDNLDPDTSAQEQSTVDEEGTEEKTARQGKEKCQELQKKKKRKHANGHVEDEDPDKGTAGNGDHTEQEDGETSKKKKRKRNKERVTHDSATDSKETEAGICSDEKGESEDVPSRKKKKIKTLKHPPAEETESVQVGSEAEKSSKKKRKSKERHGHNEKKSKGLLEGRGEEEQEVDLASGEVKQKKKRKIGSPIASCYESRSMDVGMDGLLSPKRKADKTTSPKTGPKNKAYQTSLDGLLVVRTPKKLTREDPLSSSKLKKKGKNENVGIEADKKEAEITSNGEGAFSKHTQKVRRKKEEGTPDEMTITKKKKKKVGKETKTK